MPNDEGVTYGAAWVRVVCCRTRVCPKTIALVMTQMKALVSRSDKLVRDVLPYVL